MTDITAEALDAPCELTTDAWLAPVALGTTDENVMVNRVRWCFTEDEWTPRAEQTLRRVLRMCAAKAIREWEATDVPLRAAFCRNA
jgi:hypothetical protein